jgi:DNA-binding SARP family transcriptional activator
VFIVSYLALFLLGPPRIERDGELGEMETRKAVALVAYLAITLEPHSRDTLATLLWPESDQTRARANLRRVLVALKKVIGEQWLEIGRESLGLRRGDGFWLDVHHFRSRLAECQTHGHSADEVCCSCLAPLAEAVELYRGDFLEGFTLQDCIDFDDWQRFQTESLRCELGNALERLMRGYSAEGDLALAIEHARHRLALDPLHEPTHCHLMQLYAQAGQRASALRQYQECVRILKEELHVPPQEETTQLYQAIRESQVQPPSLDSNLLYPYNLPHQTTPFIGRQEELAEIAQLLEGPSCRLLTLVGPGGIGKTRLALEAAARQIPVFPHRVCFVPLAAVSSASLLASSIVDALGFGLYGQGDPKVQLLNYLREKAVLLVLDNLEHLLEEASFLIEILQIAPDVKVLVTSRERLNLQGEWVLEVEGLHFPESDEASEVESYSAVQLFAQSARRVYPSFQLSQKVKPHVVSICRFMGGMPLAIEMAAAWVRSLPCAEIATEVLHNLGFLVTSLRDAPERHQSLQTVFDHSWNLLTEEEKRAFRRLSVFRGGFPCPSCPTWWTNRSCAGSPRVGTKCLRSCVNMREKSSKRLPGKRKKHKVCTACILQNFFTKKRTLCRKKDKRRSWKRSRQRSRTCERAGIGP